MNHELTVRVPDSNSNKAEIVLNGSRPRVAALDISLRPNQMPIVKMEILPDLIECDIESAEIGVVIVDEFTTRGHDPYNHKGKKL